MTALLTISDIESALGRTAEDEEELAQWQFYIDQVSFDINEYCDHSFERIDDAVVWMQADAGGKIQLIKPVIQITSVNWRDGEADLYVDFNRGTSQLYNLLPFQNVEVTYTYGWAAVPADIRHVALTAVVEATGDMATPNFGLRMKKVGDVQEQYRSAMTEVFGIAGMRVLDRYASSKTYWTMDLSASDAHYDYDSQGFLGEVYGD